MPKMIKNWLKIIKTGIKFQPVKYFQKKLKNVKKLNKTHGLKKPKPDKNAKSSLNVKFVNR